MPIGGCTRQAAGGGGAAMAAKSGVVWAPGRSFRAADVRDVARGTCRAGGLRLGPVGAARHLPGPTIGLDAPFPAATAQGAAPVFFLRRCYGPFGGYWALGLLLAANHRSGPDLWLAASRRPSSQ